MINSENTEKIWRFKKRPNEELVAELSQSLNINPILSSLLIQRGITAYEDAKLFFRPSLDHLHDPFLMKDMHKAVDRILDGIGNEERILIFGDYDVDGTTAVSLMYSFLHNLHPNIDFYIPDRYAEGYGISTASIDWAKENGYTLVITLDCGIKAIEKIDYANSLGIDYIICDHHLPGEVVPNAFAVLDPKQVDCSYPYKELSGCGVGFKLIQALAIELALETEEVYQYLDLVAISIAADIVDITGENRVLAHFGLNILNNPDRIRPGVQAILDLTSFTRKLTISDIVFTIGPRINAAGRIQSGKQAVELLIAPDKTRANEIAQLINLQNQERRTLDTAITEEAMNMIANDANYENKKSTVLYSPNWHKGVIGIVASRLIDKFYRPTIILTMSNGHVAGSARSVKDYDIYSAIESCSDLLDQFGGHKFAAGLTMTEENVPLFIERFEEIVAATITDDMLVQEVEVDLEMDINQINPKFYQVLKQFAPFGPGNQKPIFFTQNLTDKGYAKIVGENHLKLSAGNPVNNVWFDAIGFQLGHHIQGIQKEKKNFHLCYSLEENEWNGQVTLQFNIKDLKLQTQEPIAVLESN